MLQSLALAQFSFTSLNLNFVISRTFSETEQRWQIQELESFAIIYAITKLDHFLKGATLSSEYSLHPTVQVCEDNTLALVSTRFVWSLSCHRFEQSHRGQSFSFLSFSSSFRLRYSTTPSTRSVLCGLLLAQFGLLSFISFSSSPHAN